MNDEPNNYDVIKTLVDFVDTQGFKPNCIFINTWDAYNMKVNGKRLIKRLPRKLKKELKNYYLRSNQREP